MAVDKYVNMLVKDVTLSGANVLTYAEVNMGLSMFDKVGLRIQRIEYFPSTAMLLEMTAAADYWLCGVMTSDAPPSIDTLNASVIHAMRFVRNDMGTAAGGQFDVFPKVFDFANLEGGGILVTPRPLFIGMITAGLASAGTVVVRIFFTILKLSDADYFEILETRHYFGA